MQQHPHSLSLSEIHRKVRMGQAIDNENFRQFAHWLTHHASDVKPTGNDYLEFSGLGEDVVISSLNGWVSRGLLMAVPPANEGMTIMSMVRMMKKDSVLTNTIDLRMKGRVLALRLGVSGIELPTLNARVSQ